MKKWSNEQTELFCRQLSMMVSSGLSVEDGLEILARDCSDPAQKDELLRIRDQVSLGESFAEALQRSGSVEKILVRMVHIGETTGYLDQVLQALADYSQRMETIRVSLKNALTYPVILLLMVVAVVSVILFKVLPVFNEVLANLGLTLSALSRGLIQLGAALVVLAGVLALAVLAGAVIIGMIRIRHPERSVPSLLSRMPLIGSVCEQLALAQTAFALSLFTRSGYELSEAMQMTEEVAEHPRVRRQIHQCAQQMQQQQGLSEALLKSGLFKESYARMISIGLKTGRSDDMIALVARHYEEDTEEAVNRFLNTVEPLMIVLLSLIVGAILLSVMLPLMNIMSSIG